METENRTCPKVSVVIPVYNVERFLGECVDSVLRQTFRDFEIILVDDGSTDTSGQICDAYERQEESIRVIHRQNGGLSAARNTGLDAACGEYVYFLDSDDWIQEKTLEQLVQTVQAERADIVFFDAFVFFTDCEPSAHVYTYERSRCYPAVGGRSMLLALLETDEYRTAVPLMLLRREYLLHHELRFLQGILHEDELFTFLVYHADGRAVHCHEELYARRIRPGSIITASSMVRRYDSMATIYFTLSAMYRAEKSRDLAVYCARIARSVLAKYKKMEGADQTRQKPKQRRFCRDVLKQRGFGDLKLKIKCSKGIRRFWYRVEKKLKTRNEIG